MYLAIKVNSSVILESSTLFHPHTNIHSLY